MTSRSARWLLRHRRRRAAALVALALPSAARAADAGRIKVSRGRGLDRASGRPGSPPRSGARVQESDVIATGPDGSVGITFADDSLLSIGPNSALVIERFAFDPTTHRGSFETSLRTGTLSAVSGRLTRQSPDAMKVRTSGGDPGRPRHGVPGPRRRARGVTGAGPMRAMAARAHRPSRCSPRAARGAPVVAPPPASPDLVVVRPRARREGRRRDRDARGRGADPRQRLCHGPHHRPRAGSRSGRDHRARGPRRSSAPRSTRSRPGPRRSCSSSSSARTP